MTFRFNPNAQRGKRKPAPKVNPNAGTFNCNLCRRYVPVEERSSARPWCEACRREYYAKDRERKR